MQVRSAKTAILLWCEAIELPNASAPRNWPGHVMARTENQDPPTSGALSQHGRQGGVQQVCTRILHSVHNGRDQLQIVDDDDRMFGHGLVHHGQKRLFDGFGGAAAMGLQELPHAEKAAAHNAVDVLEDIGSSVAIIGIETYDVSGLAGAQYRVGRPLLNRRKYNCRIHIRFYKVRWNAGHTSSADGVQVEEVDLDAAVKPGKQARLCRDGVESGDISFKPIHIEAQVDLLF